jgi:DNA-binding MltR family transcriptional regulator
MLMADRDAILDLGSEAIAEMDREFHTSPDRVIAVVGAAYLDSMLDRLFRAVLIDSAADVDGLLRPDGALGSNGTRYQLAFCLDLIARDQRDDLRLIAKIRNKFAHDFKISSFDEEPIRGYCSSLKQPGDLAGQPAQLFDAETAAIFEQYVRQSSATSRERFRTSVFTLFGSLLRRLLYVERPSHNKWFSYDPDALLGPTERL